MKMKPQYRLNIKSYSNNAAKKFTFQKLIILTIISVLLTAFLIIDIVKQQYNGKALVFTIVALVLILGYTILNVIALIKKMEMKK